jgi:hypothetical protein
MARSTIIEIPTPFDAKGDTGAAAQLNAFSSELHATSPNEAFSAAQGRLSAAESRYQSDGVLPAGLQLVDSNLLVQPTVYEKPALQAVRPMPTVDDSLIGGPFDSNQKLNVQITNVAEISQGILSGDSLNYLYAYTKSGADAFSTPVITLLEHMAHPGAFNSDALNTLNHFAQSPNQFNADAQSVADKANDFAARVSDDISQPMSVDDRAKMAGSFMSLFFLPGDKALNPEVTKQMSLETKSAEELEKLGIKRVEVPINPVTGTTAEKLAQLEALTAENKPLVENLMRKIDENYGTVSQLSVKDPREILGKAARPSIRETQPWFDVEHVRDSLRFKTPVTNLEDLPKIAKDLKESGFKVIKVDLEKLLAPKGRGWRMAALDLRAPNGQIIEYQVLTTEMNEAGNIEHEAYEQWRNRDAANLTPEEQQAEAKTKFEAVNLYSNAWNTYLTRTCGFWRSRSLIPSDGDQLFW